MSARDRGKLIARLAELLWERREEFALVESLKNGKTFREAIRGDVGPGRGDARVLVGVRRSACSARCCPSTGPSTPTC